MSKDKELIGLGAFSNNLIEKGNALYSLLLNYDYYSIKTIKVFEFYLSRINSRNSDELTVVLDRNELKDVLGVNKVRKSDVERIKDELLSYREWSYYDETGRLRYKSANLFFEAGFDCKVSEDYVDEVERFYLKCVPDKEVLELFYNLEKYCPYRFENIRKLSNDDTGKRQCRMFWYLKMNSYRHSWFESPDKIKDLLLCSKADRNLTSTFNRSILFPVCDYINKNTDLSVVCELKQEGKSHKIIGYTFSVKDKMRITSRKYKLIDDFVDVEEYWNYIESLPEAERDAARVYQEEVDDKKAVANIKNSIAPHLDPRLTDNHITRCARLIFDFFGRQEKFRYEDDIRNNFTVDDMILQIQEYQDVANTRISEGQLEADKFGAYVCKCFENYVTGA